SGRSWRLPPGRTRPPGARGLAIVAAVATAHGGRATACSQPDGGALVSLEMPDVVVTLRDPLSYRRQRFGRERQTLGKPGSPGARTVLFTWTELIRLRNEEALGLRDQLVTLATKRTADRL